MDASIATPLPAPSAAWSHVAATQLPGDPDGEAARTALASGAHRRTDDAEGLRARLLDLIVAREKTRKAASAESNRPR